MERVQSFGGDVIARGAAELGRQRQHAAQYLADWRDVIVRDPLSQLHQLIRQCWRRIQHLLYSLGFEMGLAIMPFDDDAAHSLLAEGNDHPSADTRLRQLV